MKMLAIKVFGDQVSVMIAAIRIKDTRNGFGKLYGIIKHNYITCFLFVLLKSFIVIRWNNITSFILFSLQSSFFSANVGIRSSQNRNLRKAVKDCYEHINKKGGFTVAGTLSKGQVRDVSDIS